MKLMVKLEMKKRKNLKSLKNLRILKAQKIQIRTISQKIMDQM
jgi:hypothetical protein